MENYVTLVYLPEDSNLAKTIADKLEEKHVDVHSFEHVYKNKELLKDIRKSAALIIVQEKEAFDYREFLKPIMKADNKCQIITIFKEKATYQNKFSMNEIVLEEKVPIDSYISTICCLIVGGYRKLSINAFNREKYRKLAIDLYNKDCFVWSLAYFLKVFTIEDTIVKERIAKAYRKLLNSDMAINYYSICLPDDNASKASICNELHRSRKCSLRPRKQKLRSCLRHPRNRQSLPFVHHCDAPNPCSQKALPDRWSCCGYKWPTALHCAIQTADPPGIRRSVSMQTMSATENRFH